MLSNKKTKRNLAILLMAAVVVGLTMTAWAKKPTKPPKPPKPPHGGGDGPVGTGTIYYSNDGLWSMNPDGSGKTLMDEPGGAASIARHPAEGDRWFLQVQTIPGEFYPITTFPPEYWNYEWREGDIEAVGSPGDPDPDGAWTISYTIMIESIGGEGEADTFEWHAHSSLFSDTNNLPGGYITGSDQELDLFPINGLEVVLTIKFGSTTGHNINDWWEIYVRKTQRSELFAVSEDGQEVQLTDDPAVQPWRPRDPSWATDIGVVDGKVSYLAQRWEGAVVVEQGLFAVEITWDDDGNPTFFPPAKLPVTIPMGPYDWSPDGTRIVYSAGGGILVANPYSEGAGTLLCGGSGPRWSPELDDDGSTLIAFRAGSWDDAQIRTISPDGGPPTTIVTVGKNRTIRGDLIHWSPMGTHLVYTVIHSKACAACQYNDSYDVYRVGADGSDPTNLTKGIKENCLSLDWRD